jgi:hypothetical protein
MRTLCLLLAVCAAVTGVRADRRDDDRRDRREHGPRVIVYQHADFRGDFLVVFPGEALENLSDVRFADGSRANDSISSIRVEDGAEIYVYQDSRFRGWAMRLTESVRDLNSRRLSDNPAATWNDRISSLRVEVRRREPAGRRPDPDDIIRRAFRDLLLREPDLSGLGGLRRLIVEQGWTEEMVRDHIRHGDEFRGEGANRLIRLAYRDVLGRDPDSRELERYRRYLLEKNWLAEEVREDLRRTDEYRRRAGGRH